MDAGNRIYNCNLPLPSLAEVRNTFRQISGKAKSPKHYLDLVAEVLQKWTGCHCVGIRVLNEEGHLPYESYTGYSYEFWESENFLSVQKDQCACIRAVTGRWEPQDEPVVTRYGSFCCSHTTDYVNSLTSEEKERFRGTCVQYGLESVAVIPLYLQERIIGLVHLADERAGQLSIEVVEFIEWISHFISEAIQEEKLKVSHDRFFDILENASDLIQSVTPDGQYIYVNRAWRETLGYTEEEVKALSVFDVVHPEKWSFCKEGLKIIGRKGVLKNIQTTFVTKDGQFIEVEGSATCRYEDGEPAATRGVFRDVTERKKVEGKLLRSENFLNNIIDAIQDGITVVDKDLTIKRFNAQTKVWFKAQHPQVGKKCFAVFHGRSVPCEDCLTLKTFETGQSQFTEKRTTSKNGQDMWLELKTYPIIEEGKISGVIEYIRDITKRKRAEMGIRIAKEAAEAANRTKSQFLANMSHEIRTPMNGIIGMTELVLETDLTDKQRKYLVLAQKSACSLMNVINDILDFSKIEAKKLELFETEFNLGDLVKQATAFLSILAKEKHITLDCIIYPGLPELILGDADRIRQVLINLIGNAVKFTEKGKVEVRVQAAASEVLFTITDTGPGIPAGKLDDLFNSFTQLDGSLTRKYGGTGLGLAISKRLVEMMNGSIWVESEEGKGSTFSFTVPHKKRRSCL